MYWRWLEVVVVLAIAAIVVSLGPFSTVGSIHYFSPDTLESTYKTEWVLLGPGSSVYRSSPKPKESPLIEYLIAKGYWSPRPSKQPHWMVTGHFNVRWRDGQSMLHRELYWYDDMWIEWSESNPDRAAKLWPRILTLLRETADSGDRAGEYQAVELLWHSRNP